MRILVVAYGYSGRDVSESYSAFQLVRALRQNHHVTVITKDPVDEHDAIRISVTPTLAGTQYYRALKLDYFVFMWRAYRLARKIANTFDLVHHISPISLRYPNILCNLDKPFIWGPVGGSIPYPPAFREVEKREPWIYRLKALDRLRLCLDPLMINTLRNAKAIVLTSSAAASLLPKRYLEKVVVIPEAFEVGVLREILPLGRVQYVFSSGRLVPYKAMEFLIKAFAKKCLAGDLELWISGDGPETLRLVELVKELQLEERCKLLGRVSKERNYELMAGSLFCVFPALNEAFGHVNLEAMAAGKPVIVTDWGGPSDIVENGVSGSKIAPTNPEEFIENLGTKIQQLVQDRALREQMGVNAVTRVRAKFSWEVVAEKYDRLYENVVNGAFGNPSPTSQTIHTSKAIDIPQEHKVLNSKATK
jgi:glycosyltransferase involved in cell wall biosynthesis